MMLAKNMDDVKKSLLLSDSSFYNIVFATEDGHIGYTAIGKSIQKNHVDSSIFKDGTKKEHDWAHLGFVPDHVILINLIQNYNCNKYYHLYYYYYYYHYIKFL
jgi:hypothetical protein